MKNANVRVDSKLVVIPCSMQITPKQNHILNRVEPTKFGKGRRIRETAWIAFADPLDIQP